MDLRRGWGGTAHEPEEELIVRRSPAAAAATTAVSTATELLCRTASSANAVYASTSSGSNVCSGDATTADESGRELLRRASARAGVCALAAARLGEYEFLRPALRAGSTWW